jgi:hypothetical protein
MTRGTGTDPESAVAFSFMNLRAVISSLLLAVFLVGCNSTSGTGTRPSPSSSPRPSPSPLSVAEVSRAACFGKPIHRTLPNELEFFTSAGATCGQDTTIAIFDGPGGRDSYASMAGGSNRILKGLNWIVWIDRFNNKALYRDIQAKIGGKIVG